MCSSVLLSVGLQGNVGVDGPLGVLGDVLPDYSQKGTWGKTVRGGSGSNTMQMISLLLLFPACPQLPYYS